MNRDDVRPATLARSRQAYLRAQAPRSPYGPLKAQGPASTATSARLRAAQTEHPLFALQRSAGNHAVAGLVVQRMSSGRCTCGGGCGGCGRSAMQDDDLQRIPLVPGLVPASVQRTPAPAPLRSPKLSGNSRVISAATDSPPLRRGEQGDGVAVMQDALGEVGYMPRRSRRPDGSMDGNYGPATQAAVRQFQEAHSVPYPSGHEAGRRTLTALDARLRGGPKPKPKPPPKPTPPGCNYLPGEREQARKNDGDIEGSGNRFRLTGFSPGDATLKPAHERFLRKFILQRPFEVSGAENGFAVGVTDCVSEEGSTDRALRLERARSVVRFARQFAGAGFTFTALDDPMARITGDNDTPAARARNRAVELTFSRAPCDQKRVAEARKSVESAEARLAAARARLARAKADEVKVALARAACGLSGPSKGAEECYKAFYPEQKRIAKELREAPIAIRAAEQDLATARSKLRAAEQELAQCSSGAP